MKTPIQSNCWYCGCDLQDWDSSRGQTNIKNCRVREHQTPKSKGGRITVAACVSCNSRKGTKDLEEYRSYIRGKFPTMKAANALVEVLLVLEPDLRNEIEVMAARLERLTPRIVFFGEKTEHNR